MCCTSTWPVNKHVLAFTLFVRNSSHPVYNDCLIPKKQPISTVVVLEFPELLKWITKWYWNLSELYECKHICHRDRFIFYHQLCSECFIMPASLSLRSMAVLWSRAHECRAGPRGFSFLARLYYLATKTAMLRRLSKSNLLTLIKKNCYVQLFYKLSLSCSHRN